jgi:hypothetical protein
MFHRRMMCALLAVSAALALGACRTMPDPEPGAPKIAAGQMVAFVPTTANAQLRFKEGAYPNLFGGASSAAWNASATGPDSTESTAPAAMPGLLTIECRMESTFGDMSIAYDAVGFRGIDVYLMGPDGKKIYPAQSVVGSELQEQQQGALKLFRRTNLLLFPAAAMQVAVPGGAGGDTALRLVLDGYDSVFYFEWTPQLPQVNVPPKFCEREDVKAARAKVHTAHRKFLNWTHKFD